MCRKYTLDLLKEIDMFACAPSFTTHNTRLTADKGDKFNENETFSYKRLHKASHLSYQHTSRHYLHRQPSPSFCLCTYKYPLSSSHASY